MKENTENTILEVARKQFVQNGFAATRMQEIADEAGINKAMLHYYFRSKEKLYHEIVVYTLGFFFPKIAEAMEAEGSFWDKTERIVDTYIKTLLEHPEIPIFIMSELSQERDQFIKELKKGSAHFPSLQTFFMQMTDEMNAGKIKEIPPIHLILNILGMTVFPFIAKPMFRTIFDFDNSAFESLMRERKDVIITFLRNALKP